MNTNHRHSLKVLSEIPQDKVYQPFSPEEIKYWTKSVLNKLPILTEQQLTDQHWFDADRVILPADVVYDQEANKELQTVVTLADAIDCDVGAFVYQDQRYLAMRPCRI